MERRDVPAQPARTPGDGIVIVAFAALLLAPALLALTGHAGFDAAFIEGTERRVPFVAPAPSSGALATGGWQRDAEREIADAFPLRRALLTSYQHVKYAWLHDVGSAHVIAGRNGWLFLGEEERAYLTGAVALNDAQLRAVADLYRERAAWCARRRITFVFLLAPDKSTIYPQYLPADVRPARPTIADRLIPLLRARGVRVADPRAALAAAARTKSDVYSPVDTHWTDPGAFIAYRATLSAIRGSVVRDVPPRGIVARRGEVEGDLLRLAGISDPIDRSATVFDYPRRAIAVPAQAPAGDRAAPAFSITAYAVRDPRLPKAVIFGDSFLTAIRPLLAENFRRSVFAQFSIAQGPQFDRELIEAEQPDIVIQELVERNLVFAATFER